MPQYFEAYAKKTKTNKLQKGGIEFICVTWALGS